MQTATDNKQGANRDKPILLRLTEAEKRLATERAAALGLSLSAYLRLLIHQDRERRGGQSAPPGA